MKLPVSYMLADNGEARNVGKFLMVPKLNQR